MRAEFAAALRSFAALVEASSSDRAALQAWHETVTDPTLSDALRSVARRAALGAPLDRVLEPLRATVGSDADLLAAALRTHQSVGGLLGPTVRRLAEVVERRADLSRQGRAASAAATLSGRLLVILAFAYVVVLPVWRTASALSMMLATGTAVLLGAAGARWMRALLPRPAPHDHPVASFADIVAGSLAGGVHVDVALDVASFAYPDHRDLQGVRCRALLGMRWPDAFAASADPTLRELGAVLDRSIRYGASIRLDLERFAAALREREQAAFEIRSRRAPVLLVLPLTLCVLPAFAIFVLVPLLRGLG